MAAKKKAVSVTKARVTSHALVGARELYTLTKPLDDGHPIPELAGAIVRIRPDAYWTDEQIETTKRVAALNALQVTCLPRPRAKLLPERVHVETVAPIGEREVVLDLVEESSAESRPLLKELCESLMAKAGI